MRFERWARNVDLAFLEVFAGCLYFHVFFRGRLFFLLGKKLFFVGPDTESWMVDFHESLELRTLSRMYPPVPSQLGGVGFIQLRPCWASIGACYP